MQGNRRTLSMALAVLLCAASGPRRAAAAAQATKAERAKPAEASVPFAQERPARARSTRAGGEGSKGPRARYRSSGEEAIALDAKADLKRDEQIELLEKLVPKASGEEKAEALFQLAELWWEKSRFVSHRGVARFDEAASRWAQRKKAREDPGPEPRLEAFVREADRFRQEALRLYEELLASYPKYARRDEVLFALAYGEDEVGRKGEATRLYEQLVERYPRSRFFADAWVQLGEHFFGASQLGQARAAYQKALTSGGARVRTFALYKLAWCDYNAGAFADAVQKLEDVVSHAGLEKGSTGLRTEALNDLALCFAQLDRVDEALAYFRSIADKGEARRLGARLAGLFQEAGRRESAIQIYRRLIDEDPADAHCPEYQEAIVESFEGLRQRDRVAEEMRRLVERTRPGGAWAAANRRNPGALAAADEITEGAMRRLSTEYHQEAQRTRKVETYRLARELYRDYLERFADSEHAYALRYYYADVLWALDELEPAAAQYLRVVQMNSAGPYSKVAAYDAVLCYERLADLERKGRRPPEPNRSAEGRSSSGPLVRGPEPNRSAEGRSSSGPLVRGLEPNRSAEGRSSSGPLVRGPELKAGQKVDDRKDPGEVEKEIDRIGARGGEDREEPIPAYEQRLVEVIDRCVATYPGLEDEIALRYKAAFVFYDHRHDVEAARRFGELIARWPADPFSRKAADLTLHLLEARRQWLELNRRARELLSNAPLIDQDRDFGARVLDLVAASQYQYADQTLYQERKDPAQAATKLRELAAEFPRSRHAPQALLYAMLLHAEAGQLDLGIEEGQRLLKDYPDAKAIDGKDLVGRALQALSSCYERTADFQSAADLNERFADRVLAARAGRSQPGALEELGEDAAKAADALYDAARWNEGLGRLDRAAALYRRYLAAFPARQARKDIRAAELYLNLGVLAVKAKDFQEAARLFKSYVERYGAQVGPGAVVLAKAQEMGALSQLGKEAEALAKAAQVVRSYQALSAQEKTSEGALEALAHARFLWLEPQWRAYLALRFDDLARFGRDYPAKVRAIGDSEKGTGLLGAYAAVVRIGAADWALAAAARIGMAYEDFAQRLLESPDPKGLDDEQLALYRGELERGAFPLEEKAAAAFESVVAASAQKQIYNEWTLEAQAALNRYRPGTFPEVRLVPLEGAEPFLTAGPMMGEPAVAKGTEPGRGGP